MSNHTNLYTLQKTITFDLKPQSVTDNFEFKNSVKWMESFFIHDDKVLDESDLINAFDLSREFRFALNELINNWEAGKGLIVHKELIKFVDRNEYHKIKSKTIKVEQINPVNGNRYLEDIRIKDLVPLYSLNKIFRGLGLFEAKFKDLIDKIGKYENQARVDYELKNNPSSVHLFSGKVKYYGNIRAWLEYSQELIKVINWINLDEISLLPESKVAKNFQAVASCLKAFESLNLEQIKDFANDNARKEVELTTLNFKAVNKDSTKIQGEIDNLEKLEKEMEINEQDLERINSNKRECVEKLDEALVRNLPELNLLNTRSDEGKNCHELFQIKSEGKSLNDQEEKIVKEMKFQKTVLKYLKFKGFLVTDKNQIKNYRQSGEALIIKKIPPQNSIKNLVEYPKFEREYNNYTNLLKEKFVLSKKLGDSKALYNTTFREISRQKQCNHFSIICRDLDVLNPFYYLVLIPNKIKDELNQVYKDVKMAGDSWELLEIQRLTFKALEKLALLDVSTFDIPDSKLTYEVKKIMADYKAKSYKSYRLSREEKNSVGYDDQSKYIVKMESENLQKLIEYCGASIKKLCLEQNYNFDFDYSKTFTDFEDYKNYLEQTCYSKKWSKISFENIKKLEQENKIRVLKIHNKDFRKVKKENSKDNLFTQYWLDGMTADNTMVRILPEIDIYKRAKEEQKEQITRDLQTSNKEIVAKARIFQDKLQGAFRLEFYSANKKETVENINQIIKENYSKQTYFLGIDRGEKELASYCLTDSTGQLIENGCWNIQKTNLNDQGVNFAERIKNFYGMGDESIWIKLETARQAISQENNKEQKLLRIKEFKKIEEELKIANELASDFVKNSYCAYMIGEINKILVKYPHTYIVLEDLNIASKNLETDETNKEQTIKNTLGASVYQVIENALVSKFKYYTVKTGEYIGEQLVPDISKIEDLRIGVPDEKQISKIKITKSKSQIGNILFVDEENTSRTCPECSFCVDKKFREKVKNSNVEIVVIGNEAQIKINNIFYSLPNLTHLEIKAVDFVKSNLNQLITSKTKKSDICEILEFRFKSGKQSFTNEAKKNDLVHCPACKFSSTNNQQNSKLLNSKGFEIKSGDDVASYNIAKRGLEFIFSDL